MRKFKEKWAQIPWDDRTIYIIELLTTIAVIAFGLTLLLGIGDGNPDFAMLLNPIAMLIFAFGRRKEHRTMALFELCTSVFISLVILIRFIL